MSDIERLMLSLGFCLGQSPSGGISPGTRSASSSSVIGAEAGSMRRVRARTPASSRIGYAIEQMCELIRLKSEMRSRCREDVSMLSSVLPARRPRCESAYARSRSRNSTFCARSSCALFKSPCRNTLMPRRRFATSRACRSQISAMPASEKLRCLVIFLSTMSVSTRSMMSPTCSRLIVNEMMSAHRRPSFSSSASREICVR